MTVPQIMVIKMSGERVPYDASKLENSLKRSGASEDIVQHILTKIEKGLYDGIPTREIYDHAFALLRKSNRSGAARYKLKNAIMELGPTGFPFEEFVGMILQHEGFKTNIDVIVKGHCVNHEVDVVASQGDKQYMVECKFHGIPGKACDVKVPLYIHSRFLDLEAEWKEKDGKAAKFHQGWIVTNTRFTSDALQFGTCVGLHLIGWNYPYKGGLKELIDSSGLHPLTCLTSLTNKEKKRFLDNGVVLSRDLRHNAQLLRKMGIPDKRHEKIMEEAQNLYVTKTLKA